MELKFYEEGRVELPQGIEYIQVYGLGSKRIPSLSIPSSVKTINEEFVSLDARILLPDSFIIADDNPFFKVVNGVVYKKDDSAIILCPRQDNDFEYEIPEGVKRIGSECFCDQEHLIKISIPDSIEEIGHNAFRRCKKLKSIHLPSSLKEIICTSLKECDSLESIYLSPDNPNYCVIDDVLFTKDMKALCLYPQGKKDKKYVIPDGVEEIWDFAFEGNTYLEEVTIPTSIREIRHAAFYGCTSLQIVDLPNVPLNIETEVFALCKSLTTISLGSEIIDIGSQAFFQCVSLNNCHIDDEIWLRLKSTKKECRKNGIKKISASAFYRTPVMELLRPKE